MGVIDKYFYSILFLIIGIIPACVGLLLFDHSMISNSDIIKISGIWGWVVICIMYTALFILIYDLNIILVHPKVWKGFNIDYRKESDEWKATISQMFFYSLFAIGITYLKEGNFIHYIANSLIISISVNAILLISYLMLEKDKKYKNS